MNRPEDIPERVWAEATNEALAYIRWLGPVSLDSDAEHVLTVSFARTILAAEKRVREECAQIAERAAAFPGTRHADIVDDAINAASQQTAEVIAAAIRKGGEHA